MLLLLYVIQMFSAKCYILKITCTLYFHMVIYFNVCIMLYLFQDALIRFRNFYSKGFYLKELYVQEMLLMRVLCIKVFFLNT